MELLKEVIKEISPSETERTAISRATSEFLNRINKGLKGAKAVVGGSGAKDTWLKGNPDIDVFVQFDYNKYKGKNNELSETLETILKKRFTNIVRLHGSRDYFRIKQGNVSFEIIPVLKISRAKQAENITDVSLLHVAWVKRRIKGLEGDVRLLKSFCKANNCYGAESYIRGFSGYACEVLIIKFGSFLKLLKSAKEWKPKVIIDPEKHYKDKNAITREINKSKQESPIILIDPVQKERNATAALSNEKLELFAKAAKKFLAKPSKEAFKEKQETPASVKVRNKDKKVIILTVKPKSGKPDVAGAKLLKAFEFIKTGLTKNGFKLHESGWNNSIFWYSAEKKPLPENVIISGPPAEDKANTENFKRKYKKTFAQNGKLMAKAKRQFTTPEKLIAQLAKDDYFKRKATAVSINVL